MSIARFAADLVRELERRALPKQLVQEQDLERSFILPIASRLAARHRGVLLYAHPWSNTRRTGLARAGEITGILRGTKYEVSGVSQPSHH